MSNAIIKQQGDSSLVADNIWNINAGAGSFMLGVFAGIVGTAMVRACRPRQTAAPSTPKGWPIAFIHRGGGAVVPEDTIVGFKEGLKYGDAVIECDVHSSLDGELVVMHDEVVDRTTDGKGRISELSYVDIQQLDAGYRFTSDNGSTFPWRGRGVTVPTLGDIFAEFPDLPINVEIKKSNRPDIEERVDAAIEAADAEPRTLVVSQSRATLRRFRRVSDHRIATAASKPELVGWWLLSLLHLTRLIDPPFQALQAPDKYKGIPIVTPEFVRAAHTQNLRVDVWTIDDEADMRRLLSFGVDGIMTDRPDVLARVLGRRPSEAQTSNEEAAQPT